MGEGVGFVDMWLNFVGRDDFFMSDGLHLTGKGAAVLGCEFARVVDDGKGTKGNLFKLDDRGTDRENSKEYYYKYTSKEMFTNNFRQRI